MRRLVALMLLLAVPFSVADDPDPPVLHDLTIERTAYAPGETVAVTMEWHDASGVAMASADIEGPNGLEVTMYDCGDPAKKRIAVVVCRGKLPERAPGGDYRVKHAWATDVVGHVANVWQNVPFTVESPYTDTEPPRLTAVTVEVDEVTTDAEGPTGTAVHVPDALRIHADDETGLADAHLSFVGPGGNDRVWGQCERTGSPLVCSLYVMRGIPAGVYTLDRAGLADTVGYRATWDTDPDTPWLDLEAAVGELPSVRVRNNHTDASPPLLTGVAFPGELHRGQEFVAYINGTDETGVEWVALGFRTSRGNADFHVQDADCEGDWGTQFRLVCRTAFPRNYPLGLAYVSTVFLSDPGHNNRHYVPVEWGWYGEHKFQDDDLHDVGTILVPRPVEGVVEAVDAIENEVVPGDVATIVYRVEDKVDEVVMTFENEDGDTLVTTCDDPTEDLLGRACDLPIPETAGVFSLKAVEAHVGDAVVEDRYDVPLVAVGTTMPEGPQHEAATGGGSSNTVGTMLGRPPQDAPDDEKDPGDTPDKHASGVDKNSTGQPDGPEPGPEPEPPSDNTGNASHETQTLNRTQRERNATGPLALPDAPRPPERQTAPVLGLRDDPSATRDPPDEPVHQLPETGEVVRHSTPAAPALLALAAAGLLLRRR